MPERCVFDYAIIRVVPHVERQEFLNAGVVLFCKRQEYLAARIDLSMKRVAVFAPNADLAMICAQLKNIITICQGGDAAGYFSQLSQSERFNWLVAPSSTVIQASPVHSGVCDNPADALQHLYDLLVC